jgi:DNA polymerase III gamma/tau subunit
MVVNAVGTNAGILLRKYSPEELQIIQRFATKVPITNLITLSEIISEHLVRLRSAVSPQITMETMMLRLLQTVKPLAPALIQGGELGAVVHVDNEKRIVEQSRPVTPKKASTEPGSSNMGKKIPIADLTTLQKNWPRVLESIKHQRRLTWTLLSSQSRLTSFESGLAQISLPSAGALDSFERSNSGDVLKKAMQEVFEGDFSIEMVVKGLENTNPTKYDDSELSESSHEVTGEDLLIKELGAKIIHTGDE